jgi:hypothetical protein
MKNKLSTIAYSILLMCSFAGCTKYKNPPPNFEKYTQYVDTTVKNKVLFISIDGAPGSEVEAVMPPTIDSMLAHSKYTWSGQSESRTDDPSTWASVGTGVGITKHLIQDDTFLPIENLANPSATLPFYPSFFYRIFEAAPSNKSLVIGDWEQLNDKLFIYADNRITTTTDVASKDTAVQHLQTDNSAVTLVDFRSVEAAGTQSGFSAGNPAFSAALKTVDSYVGEMMTTIKSRKTYKKENWLVIITTNHGGTGTSYGGSSVPERNIFALFYNAKYQPLELKGQTINSVDFNSTISASAPDPTGIYNLGTGNMTVEMKIKVNPGPSGNYQFGNYIFMFGQPTANGKGGGWGIFRQNTAVSLYLTDNNGNNIQQNVSNAFIDGKWHSLTIVMTTNKVQLSRTVITYIDGAPLANQTGTNSSAPSTPATPLVIGNKTAADFNLEDIRIFNIALGEGDIANDACSLGTGSGQQNYANLIGYWPGQDGTAQFVNQIANAPNFAITGPYSYLSSPNTLNCDLGVSNVVVGNITFFPQIMYWLNIPVSTSWNLDGSVFLSKFAQELQ